MIAAIYTYYIVTVFIIVTVFKIFYAVMMASLYFSCLIFIMEMPILLRQHLYTEAISMG